jgi:hypothetical protein
VAVFDALARQLGLLRCEESPAHPRRAAEGSIEDRGSRTEDRGSNETPSSILDPRSSILDTLQERA